MLRIVKAVLRIYCIHCTGILAICLSMYFSGLDLPLAFLYLAVIWQEARHNSSLYGPIRQGILGFIWQLPAIFLSLSILLGLDRATDFSYYFIFILQLWHTPVLPIISLLPLHSIGDKPLYYYLLFLMVPLLWSFYLLPRDKRGRTCFVTHERPTKRDA